MSISNKTKLAGTIGGLAAILIVSLPDVRRITSNFVSNSITDVLYEQRVTSDKYVVIDYTIKPGDRLRKLIGGNELAIDYARTINPSMDITNLRPGTKIKIPIKSEYGKTIPELFEEYEKSRK